jgi:hypothetical protein
MSRKSILDPPIVLVDPAVIIRITRHGLVFVSHGGALAAVGKLRPVLVLPWSLSSITLGGAALLPVVITQ